MKRIIRQITEHAEEDSKNEQKRFYIKTGLTMLNLGLSDRTSGGFMGGKLINLIGDSSSGKTFLALQFLADAANNPKLDDYQLIHDDPESGNEFNIKAIFGRKAFERIKPPSVDPEGMPVHSETVTDFQANVRKYLKSKKPCIYILDSFDSIYAEEEMEHAEAVEKARAKGKKPKGTYGMQKAKAASILLRLIVGMVKKTNSLVIIVSQTRDNIDPMSFQPRTRAGGKALKFYSSVEMWTAVEKPLTKEIGKNAKKVGIGLISKIKISKNRTTGKVRTISIPIYFDYGPDDIGSCVDFLIAEKIWDKRKGVIHAPELGVDKKRNDLIRMIEENGLHKKLKKIVQNTWNDLEKQLEGHRKPRYE